jgi:hypothetical protein
MAPAREQLGHFQITNIEAQIRLLPIRSSSYFGYPLHYANRAHGVEKRRRNTYTTAAAGVRPGDTIAKYMIHWIPYRFVMVDYSPQPTDVAELILHRMVHVPAEAKDWAKCSVTGIVGTKIA